MKALGQVVLHEDSGHWVAMAVLRGRVPLIQELWYALLVSA